MKVLFLIMSLIMVSCGDDLQEKPAEDTEQAKTEDEVSFSIAITDSQEMPRCEARNFKQLIYVKSESTFYTCADGWEPIKIAHPEIAESDDSPYENKIDDEKIADKNSPEIKTEKEPKGKNCSQGGMKISNGSEVTYICNGLAGKDGKNGNDGTNGTDGVNGVDGSDGTNGTDGNTGVSIKVFDANDNHIGYLSDSFAYTVMLKDGNMTMIDFKNDFLRGAKAYNSIGLISAQCYYTTNNCSGTCYIGDSSNTVSAPMKNWIIQGKDVYYQIDGTEQPELVVRTMRSRMVNGQCVTGTWYNSSSIPITTVWENSEGIQLPIARPLYFGK